MEGAILLPTLGVGMEQALLHDLDARGGDLPRVQPVDGGGLGVRLPGADLRRALHHAVQARRRRARTGVGARARRAVHRDDSRTDHDEVGMRAPGDPMFDDFWRLANDSGITVCYHSGETYYSKFMPAWGESDYMMSFQALLGFRSLFSGDALQDTFANHLHNGLFPRFPNLRMASIESGSAWVFHLFEKLTKSYGQIPQIYQEDPRETFKRHVWVSPFYEDELASLLKLLGARPHHHGIGLPARRRPGRAGVLHQGSGELRLHPGTVPPRDERQRCGAVHSPARVTAFR